jgi:Acyl-CoA reductase (LuxC)
VRAFPPRLVHVIAGNTPAVAVTTILRGALSKGVNLIKVPANDLFTAAAILRTMSQIDPDHPTVRSFSAVYWKGGDTRIESAIMRPQFFDKLVVWGGDSAVANALRYAGPGFEIVSFDPKVSISMVGREIYSDDALLDDAAERAAIDVSLFNQDACAASRYVYVEGDIDEVDRFSEKLLNQLVRERPLSSAVAAPLSGELRDEVEVLKTLEPIYRVWGDYSGAGLVVRSEDPVDFYPISKTVNVVAVDSLEDAVRYANVATQTVGIYPPQRAAALRDALAGMGVQRVVTLGEVAQSVEGLPHDGFYPIRRLMRWVLDDTSA